MHEWANEAVLAPARTLFDSASRLASALEAPALLEDHDRSSLSRQTYESGDLQAVVSSFTYPCVIATDTETSVALWSAESAEQLTALLAGLLDSYRRLGVTGAGILELATIELTPRLAQIRIRPEIRGAFGPLYDFQALYTVVLVAGVWRIAGIAHDEQPKLRALAPRSA